MINNLIKCGNLANSRCAKRREFDFETTSEKTNTYKKALIIKSVISKYYNNEIKYEEIENIVTKKFAELDYESEHQRNAFIHEAVLLIHRYIESLKSCKVTPRQCSPMELNLFDVSVLVSADCIFLGVDSSSNQKCLEVVKIRCSRPTVTQNGTKKDASAFHSLELYAMLKYGQKCADMILKPRERMTVKASYIFLKSGKDKNGTIDLTVNVYDDIKNHVSIVEQGYYTGQPESESSMDQQFKPQYEDFFVGEECTPEQCEACDFYQLCNYKLPPKYIIKQKVQKSIRDLNLTPQQEEAIYFKKGICRINAGAGAGKTLVVALHVTMMILDGIDPSSIICLTFTNAGASEMKERIAMYVADINPDLNVSGLTVTTFNAYADAIVRKNYDKLGFTKEPTLIDDVERAGIIAELLNETYIDGLNYKMFSENSKYVKGALTMCTKAFDIIKRDNLSLGDEALLEEKIGLDMRFMSKTALPQLLELYAEYDNQLKSNNLIEFADQELLMFQLLAMDPYYLEQFNISHIIVDEFQDSSKMQIDLIKEFVDCPSFESLMVVGDDSQAIFSFRDTTPDYIINFFDVIETDDGSDFYLLENHRSTPEIIEFANKINALNEHRVVKDLIATRAHGKPVIVRGFYSGQQEYEYIADSIVKKISNGTPAEEIAYIAGDKYELLKMGSRLTELGIQWVMLNPEPVLENAKVIAAIELAKAFQQPNATSSILIYLNALYEGKLIDEGEAFMKDAIDELQSRIEDINTLSDEEKQEKFYELLLALDDDDELYQAFLETLKSKSSFSNVLKYLHNFMLYGKRITFKRNKDYPGVVLTTAHSSKGLEWPVVFNSITKYDSELLHGNSKHLNRAAMVEEKRRLFFVSATRARDELIVTGEYVAFGKKDDRTYNQFLKEAYDAMGLAYNPVDPMEDVKKAEQKERAKIKAKERRECKKQELIKKTMKNVKDAIAVAEMGKSSLTESNN